MESLTSEKGYLSRAEQREGFLLFSIFSSVSGRGLPNHFLTSTSLTGQDMASLPQVIWLDIHNTAPTKNFRSWEFFVSQDCLIDFSF